MIARPHQVAAGGPALVPTWQNADRSQTIYLTDDPSVNDITLTISSRLEQALTLAPGQPAAYGALPTGQSAIYLLFNGLIPNSAVDAASMTARGWSASKVFADRNTGFGYLVIAPDAEVTLAVGGRLEFTIGGLMPKSGTSGNLDLIVMAAGLTDPQSDLSIFVNVAAPPKPDHREPDLLVGFAGRDEVFTGAASGPGNELLLYITNPGKDPLVPNGRPSSEAGPPRFQIDLVSGTGQGALTNAASAAQIAVDLSNDYGNGWGPVEAHTLGSRPYWTVEPSGSVLGTGEHASVEIALTNIVTTLPQGPTYLYLSYKDIPGYNDGFLAVEIVKVDPIAIVSLSATPDAIAGASGPVAVCLSFAVDNASYVMITNTSYGRPTTGPSFSPPDGVTVEVTQSTTFTLVAANFETGQLASRSVNVDFEPAPVGVSAFAASRDSVSPGDSVRLEFTVESCSYVTITNTTYEQRQPRSVGVYSGAIDVTPRTTTLYTLLAFNTETGQVGSAHALVEVADLAVTGNATVGGVLNWGGHGQLTPDQGGAISLGEGSDRAKTPYIDFHHGSGEVQSYNARLINDGDARLSVAFMGGGADGTLSVAGEIRAKTKQFAIPHPLDPERADLVHGAIEGPENAVYYRGAGQLVDGDATIELPHYFEGLTTPEGRTVQVTPRLAHDGDRSPITPLAVSDVERGSFRVQAITDANPTQRFFWEVKAVRRDVAALEVEVPRTFDCRTTVE